jgi:hypothetical protein
VQVSVNFASAPSGQSSRRLLVYSDDANESPYPGGVFVNVTTSNSNPVLSVTRLGTGSGTVTSAPSGINCGSDCSQAYSSGTVVTLTALPAAGSTFGGWSGNADCSDGVVTMNADKACFATFNSVSGCPTTTHLSNTTISGGTYRAGDTITVGPNATADGTGQRVHLIAGNRIVLDNGTDLHGSFTAEISNNPCP